jgi:hypothetical protein
MERTRMDRIPSLSKPLLLLFLVGLIAGCSDNDSTEELPQEPTPTNSAPAITDPGALSVTEGSVAIALIEASDADGDSVTLSISGGADEAAFTLEEGALAFASAPDFEAPGDADANNVYVVEVSASDGTDATSLVLEISVSDAFEGRVIDGPVAGASVFVDLNCNVTQDDGEPFGTTDDAGFFKVGKVAAAEGCSPRVIARGGTDIATGKALPDLVLVAELPADETKAVAITPLTTVLAAAETAEDKQEVLNTLGLSGTTPEEILTTDSWAGAEAEDETATAVQRVNAQVATVLQAAAVVADDGDDTTDDVSASTLAAAAAIVGAVEAAAVTAAESGGDATLNLADPTVVATVVTETATAGGQEVNAETVAAVANVVAIVNTAAADTSLNPTSDVATQIAGSAQETIEDDVTSVVIGETTVEEFEEATDAETIFENVEVVDAPDADQDGLADSLDPDDDNDGVTDTLDVFPLDASESLDTDLDGIGNNADTDDDGDEVADASDAFPLDAAESLDTDLDGIGNNADTDDDGDGVADDSDIFPLNAAESIDTDSDGIGNNADTDDDGDDVVDASDAFPLDAAESLDTDLDGIGNNADADDDGDGVADVSDAFPLDASETIDTDADGIGNNADPDDDSDGVLDVNDGFDTISLDGRTDTDGDGFPDDCDQACQDTGMIADLDDDNDNVNDTSDALPLNPEETLDTDSDGIGNNADLDDDGDTIADADELTAGTDPLLADSDGDGVNDNLDAFPNDADASEVGGAGATGFTLPSTITVLKTEE